MGNRGVVPAASLRLRTLPRERSFLMIISFLFLVSEAIYALLKRERPRHSWRIKVADARPLTSSGQAILCIDFN